MDVEKTIEFLLQQQAAAEVRWAESDRRIAESNRLIAESDARHRARMDEIDSQMVKLNNNQVALQEVQFRQLEMINGLIDAQVRGEARSKEIDERLNALIAVVDDLVRRRN
jgi:hypothetical protein